MCWGFCAKIVDFCPCGDYYINNKDGYNEDGSQEDTNDFYDDQNEEE